MGLGTKMKAKRPSGRPKGRQEDNIKTDLKETELDSSDS
jgi:hypothetical protein